MTILLYLIVALCILNLIRMAGYLISSDAYSIRQIYVRTKRKRWHLPTISIVVPAHNEEKTIERALTSLYESNYPASKFEVIIANDGSTDNTAQIVKDFKKSHKNGCKIRLINRPNKGKAAALNYVMKNCAKGKLVMCLDSDSYLDKQALRNAAQHFKDRGVVALSSNVNIIEDGTLLALVQRFEYLVCYQMKKGQALLGVEYIVGGIGSMFRSTMLKKVSFYDTNTMTEDIDLTMKIIVNKNRNQRVAYAADSIAFTEPAHSFKELSSQRYRWKYGRSQTFLKYSSVFFSKDKNIAKRLGWFMLPFAVVQDIFFAFEPLILGYFIFVSLRYGEVSIFATALVVLSVYLLSNVWSSGHLSLKDRIRLSFYAPAMYIAMYVLSAAEYYALVKSLLLAPRLKQSIQKKHVTWNSPLRKGNTVQSTGA